MDIAAEHTSRLDYLKECVEVWHKYFGENNRRHHDFVKFVFSTSLSSQDRSTLDFLKKPDIEFNILECILNRILGDFAQQQPGIVVRADDGIPVDSLTPDLLQMIDVLEAHLRDIILDSSNDGFQTNTLRKSMAGGFAVVEVAVEWVNELSFEKKIVTRPVFDPTLCGFDPLARESHKGDGRYCFTLYPKTRKEFEEEFGKAAADKMKFARASIGSFNWSYANDKQQIVLVCDFFEKKKKKQKLIQLSNGQIILKKHYADLLKYWEEEGFIEQPPAIVEERTTYLETICRYQFCETQVLSYEETDYRLLPLVFVDGNSVEITEGENGATGQMTRPYVYHARGIQKLRNFAGQTIGAEIENMVQHKWIVSVEAVPSDYLEAYRNNQMMDVVLYNEFYKGNTDIRLTPPREVQRTPTPPIVESIFNGSDVVTQTILGSYDSTLATNQQDVSGVAIANGAIQTAGAASPYMMGYIKALNRICEINLDLIPKYYKTPRSLPIRTPDGKRSYQLINGEGEESIRLFYQPHELGVRVEAGVNTNLQKQASLDRIIKMMQASEAFAAFINSQGMPILLDNLDIRGIDALKAAAEQWMKQQQEQAQQAAQQPDPQQQMLEMAAEVEMAKVEQQKEKAQGELAIQSAKVAIDQQKVEAQVMEIINDIRLSGEKLSLEQEKAASTAAREAVESAVSISKHNKEMREPSEGRKE